MADTKTVTLELTPLQARVIRNAFLPANPNKLRALRKVLNTQTGLHENEKFDGKDLIALAHEAIAAFERVSEA